MDSTISFRNLYKQLPQKTREVIAFEGFGDFIEEITKDNNFSRQQTDNLIRLTVHIIVGAEDKKYFSEKIKEILGVDQNTANTISTEIDQKIISNIENLYQRIQHTEGNSDVETSDITVLEDVRSTKKSIHINDLIENIKGNKLNREINSLIELIKNVSESTRKILTSSEWLKRIKEFGSKYSLTEEQTTTLIIEILLVITEATTSEELAENIEEEVGVSQILAEQLAEEAEERIFKWIKQERVVKMESTPSIPLSDSENSLDIPPPNLPGELIEEQEFKVKPVPIQDQVKDFFTSTQEPVSTPVVPSNPIHPIETPIEELIPQKPQSFISQKLSQPTAPQKYTADPYREPLE